jgi:hypothetical protein
MKQAVAPSLHELDEHLQIQVPALAKRREFGLLRRGNRSVSSSCGHFKPMGYLCRRKRSPIGGRSSVMTDEFTPLTVADYATQALTTDQRSDGGSLTFPLLGLFGETGSLLSEVKKKQRDRASYIGYAGAVVEELGDVLWYLTTVAARSLSE